MDGTKNARASKGYDSDLDTAAWAIIEPLLPPEKGGGRHRTTDLRAVVNAIFYRLRTGCAWRLLPKDFPPFQTVYEYFREWRDDGTWLRIHDILRTRVREQAGRKCTADSRHYRQSNRQDDRGVWRARL